MKIQIISDLHQELGFGELDFQKADVVVFAGDLNVGIKGIQWLIKRFDKTPVVYVLGNHEYYKGVYPKTLNKIIALSQGTNIHVLENESICINGVNFHGATLWTDFSIIGNPVEGGIFCQDKMNDYRLIRKEPNYSKLRTIDTFRIHQKTVSWLEGSLAESSASVDIVITHHAPSIQSIPVENREKPIIAAYASNLNQLILKYQPQFWIHGHIHTPARYKIEQTEVICNPHGYIDEQYNGHQKELIIEV